MPCHITRCSFGFGRITYPYKDAGVLDTTSLVTDPIYAPKGAWLGGAIGTIFGNGPNATALLLVINVSKPQPIFAFNVARTSNRPSATEPWLSLQVFPRYCACRRCLDGWSFAEYL